MVRPLEEEYFEWLYNLIFDSVHSELSYWELCVRLHKIEFVWFVPNDDNRANDGVDLRKRYLESENIFCGDDAWLSLGCSFLEMLIALSGRAVFESSEGSLGSWFMCLISNMDLIKLPDGNFNNRKDTDEILRTANRVINRAYSFNGNGGLFPLSYSSSVDQRDKELWYQLSEYIIQDEHIGRV